MCVCVYCSNEWKWLIMNETLPTYPMETYVYTSMFVIDEHEHVICRNDKYIRAPACTLQAWLIRAKHEEDERGRGKQWIDRIPLLLQFDLYFMTNTFRSMPYIRCYESTLWRVHRCTSASMQFALCAVLIEMRFRWPSLFYYIIQLLHFVLIN